MTDPEKPTNPSPEEPKAKEPTPTTPTAGPREGEKPAASKADAPPKVSGAKKSGKQKKNGQLLPPRRLRKIFRFQAVTSRSQRSSRRKAARTFIRASRMCFRRSTTQS